MSLPLIMIAAIILTDGYEVRTCQAAVLGQSIAGATGGTTLLSASEPAVVESNVLKRIESSHEQLSTEYNSRPAPHPESKSNHLEVNSDLCGLLETYSPADVGAEDVCDGVHMLYTQCCGRPARRHGRAVWRINIDPRNADGNMSSNSTDDHDHGHSNDDHTPEEEAYGYGFLMVAFISIVSLAGIAVVPFLREGTRLGQYYKYIYALLIALGVSSLFCDAILHLIPHAFNLHGHEEDHGHEEEEEEEEDEKEIIWKGCAVIGGAFFTFLLETLLHSLTAHGHGHSHGQLLVPSHSDTDFGTQSGKQDGIVHATLPHGQASCSYVADGGPPAILHPKRTSTCSDCPQEVPQDLEETDFQGKESHHSSLGSVEKKELSLSVEHSNSTKGDDIELFGSNPNHPMTEKTSERKGKCGFLRSIKPLVWVIILGDGMHNLADGIALGVAISQSLGLGMSTALAILFHEIPHEIGDYVILVSTGMKWYIALLLNFLSALTAVAGFFVGVAIGTDSEEAQNWVLAFTAGQFLYIALVDLLPELLHTKEKGRKKMGQFVLSMIGLSVGFAILLVIAIYEEELDSLIE